jgi:mannose-6-phosphate isomerase-like protein (cupin superfamily)
MKPITAGIAGIALAIALSAHADESMSHSNTVFVNATDLKWSDAPPDLPKGMQVAVLYGDPFKAGPYAMRLKMPDGYKIPPHWHTRDEQLTVMQGTFALHLGDTMKTEAHMLEAGGFHYLPAKMHHSAETKGESIVQVQGVGPFDIHYLNAADNPSPKSASR